MKQITAKVVNNIQVLPGTPRPQGKGYLGIRLIWLNCPEIVQEAKPGQFVMVRCEDCTIPRPFSLFRVYGSDIAIFYAVSEEGKGTRWLADRRTGDPVELFGPLGNGFTVLPSTRNLLLIAGGVGIAPLFYLANEAIAKFRSVTLLYGSLDRNRYPIPPEIKTIPATEDGSVGYKGRVTDLLPQYIDRSDQVFACGPMPMYFDMASKSKELKLEGKPVQVSLEVMMGCGVGACLSCSIKTTAGMKRVCKDGPVFNLNDINWEYLKG